MNLANEIAQWLATLGVAGWLFRDKLPTVPLAKLKSLGAPVLYVVLGLAAANVGSLKGCSLPDIVPVIDVTPKAETLWLVAISKHDDLNAAQGAILDRTAWPGGQKFLSVLDGTKEADKYAAYKSSMPCVIVMDAASGKVLGVEVIAPDVKPTWPAEVVAKYLGGK